MAEKMWLFINSNQQQGPIQESQLKQLIASKSLPENTLVWSDHMPEWAPANSLDVFVIRSNLPPSHPTAAPPQLKDVPSWQDRPSSPSLETKEPEVKQELAAAARTIKNRVVASVNSIQDEETREFVQGYWAQLKAIVQTPNKFFDSMPTTGGFVQPLSFLGVGLGVYCVMMSVLNLKLMIGLVLLVMIPFCVFAGGFVINWLARVMGGKGTYEATIRVYCYSYAPLVAAWIPMVGWIFSLYSLALTFIGLKKVHELTTGQTVIVIILSGILWGVVIAAATIGTLIMTILAAIGLAR